VTSDLSAALRAAADGPHPDEAAVQHAGGQATGTSLPVEDAAELADFLRFMGEWAAADHHRLSASLAEFLDGHPYGLEMLCHDLARFRSLLSGADSDIDF